MDELQTEQTATDEVADLEVKEETSTETAQVETKAEETPAKNPLEEENELLKKRLADTQSWAHQKAQEAAELKRRHDQARLTEIESGLSPEVLETVSRANEAHQLRYQQQQAKAEADLRSAVEEAVPEAMALVDNPQFANFVAQEAQKAQAAGKNTASPLTAVAVMSRALREFNNAAAKASAEQAEAERKKARMASQAMPGAGAAVSTKASADWTQDASIVKNMSSADFEKLRRKGLGY